MYASFSLLSLAVVSLLTGPSPEAPVPVFSRVNKPGHEAARAGVLAAVDRGAVQRLRAAGSGRLTVPMADGQGLTLDLTRFDVLTRDAVVVAQDEAGPRRLRPDVTLFRGAVEGDSAGWAVLSISEDRVTGLIETSHGRYEIEPGESGDGTHRIAPEKERPAGRLPFQCLTEQSTAALEPIRTSRALGGSSTQPTATRLICHIAVDCNYAYVSECFGGDPERSAAFILMLMGMVSIMYERDINVALRIPLLTLWTTPDPWTATILSDRLTQFRNYWRTVRTDVERDLALLVGCRTGAGLATTIGGICKTTLGYAVADKPDILLIPHELGHLFGSPHTHSCTWAQLGYVPAGTLLDSCTTAEGPCYHGPTGIVPPDGGTIMSYCPAAGSQLYFHPACAREMRLHAQSTCLQADSLQPPHGLVATATSSEIILNWRPSTATDVLRYDVYGADWELARTLTLLGSTTDTLWTGSLPGTPFYKVRAVRATDQSDFSNTAARTPCGPGVHDTYATGDGPEALFVSDLFDLDGVADLAVLDATKAELLLYRGQRSATSRADFTPPTSIPLGAAARALVAGGFDGDQYTDFAVAGGGSLTILRGQSANLPTISSTLAFPTAAQSALATADLDEDGILDLAMTDGDSLRVLRGQGEGGVGDDTFQPMASYAVGSGAAGLIIADLDRDGIADIAVAVVGGVAVLIGRGGGGAGDGSFSAPVAFAASVLGEGTSALGGGDFDRDGILDLALILPASGAVAVMPGRGDGTFDSPQTYACGASPRGLVCCDLDSDGQADLVTANAEAGTVSLLRGLGDGSFDAAQSFWCGRAPQAIAAQDLDDDGRVDLLVANATVPGTLRRMVFRCAGVLPTDVRWRTYPAEDTVVTGTERTLAWHRGPGVLSANLELSTDGGLRWLPLATGLVETSYVWTAAGPLTAQARLRVYDPTVLTRSAVSTPDFSIVPAAMMDVPVPPAPGLVLWGARPNPARAGLSISFALADGRPATLELFDLTGRRLRTQAVGALGPGPHVVDLAAGRTLPSGIFLVRLSQGGQTRTVRVVHMR